MAYVSDLLDVARAAKLRGMLSRGFAWLGLDTVVQTLLVGTDGEVDKAEFEAMFDGWMVFMPATSPPPSFYEDVANATRTYYPFDNASYSSISPYVTMPPLRENTKHPTNRTCDANKASTGFDDNNATQGSCSGPGGTAAANPVCVLQVRYKPVRRDHALRLRRRVAPKCA
jgi:hypothetical protein